MKNLKFITVLFSSIGCLIVALMLASCARTAANAGNITNVTPSESPTSRSSVSAPTIVNESTPDGHTRAFYRWYLGELKAGREPYLETEVLEQYLTPELIGEAKERISDKRFDPVLFIDNRDTKWHEMSVVVDKPKFVNKQGSFDAYVNVHDTNGPGGKSLYEENVIGLKKTQNGWRIASVSIEE